MEAKPALHCGDFVCCLDPIYHDSDVKNGAYYDGDWLLEHHRSRYLPSHHVCRSSTGGDRSPTLHVADFHLDQNQDHFPLFRTCTLAMFRLLEYDAEAAKDNFSGDGGEKAQH
jgi:hypothetical protein